MVQRRARLVTDRSGRRPGARARIAQGDTSGERQTVPAQPWTARTNGSTAGAPDLLSRRAATASVQPVSV